MGFAQLMLALAFLVFVPAWSLRYWHAWWYVGVFGACVVAITIYLMKHDTALLERRMSVGPRAEKEKSQKIIQALAALSFVSIYIVSALDYRFHWSVVSPFAVEIGDLLVVVGFTIIFLVFRVNSHTAGTIGVEEGQQVVEDGPYAIVRHPMYVGALIMLLATPPALASWWGELAFVPIVATIVWRLLEEEKFLKKNLPGYVLYARRVRYRLVPGVF